MSEPRSFAVLLVSQSEYRIDGAFRYRATGLPTVGDLVTVEDEISGAQRQARVRRVRLEERFPIHATDETPLPLERALGQRERARRGPKEGPLRALNGRRGWLRRRRRRRG